MEEFKKTIRMRANILKVCLLLSVMVNIILNFGPIETDNEFALGFQEGLMIGLTFLALVGLYKYLKVLKNEQELQKLYISETDERKRMIIQKMAQSSLVTIIVILLLAICIASYFNPMISIVLLCVAYGILAIILFFKIYYFKKY